MRCVLCFVCVIFVTFGHAQISFSEHPLAPSYNNPWYVFGIDIDNDTDIDAVASGRLGHSLTWWENIDNVNFTQHDISITSYFAMGVHAVDIDNVELTSACTISAAGKLHIMR
ncbi:MAG: hypothetical protein WBE28_06340 [bacterium]